MISSNQLEIIDNIINGQLHLTFSALIKIAILSRNCLQACFRTNKRVNAFLFYSISPKHYHRQQQQEVKSEKHGTSFSHITSSRFVLKRNKKLFVLNKLN